MSKETVLSEHVTPQINGGVSIKVIAITDKNTQFLEGEPLDGFSLKLGIDYQNGGLQHTSARVQVDEVDLFELAHALTAAGYTLRETRKKAARGRDISQTA